MSEKYDVIIIGAGPGGIFCAYELLEKNKDMKVLIVEKGRSIEKRMCPKRTTNQCVGCKPCSITTGFAGAGAFSDGKLSLSPDVGGNLPAILGYDKTLELIHESDDIYLKFGADKKVYGVDKEKEIWEIRKKAINANLKLVECQSVIWEQKKDIKFTPNCRNICWTKAVISCSILWWIEFC